MSTNKPRPARLSSETLETSIREMWDAIAHCPADDEDRQALIDQARAIEAKLRLRLAAQDRLDAAAELLLSLLKEWVDCPVDTSDLIARSKVIIQFTDP